METCAAERPSTESGGPVTDRLLAWLTDRRSRSTLSVRPVPFAEMDRWGFTPDGDLVHDSRRFFTVSGLRLYDTGVPITEHPVIVQPEIGILGLLVKQIDGEPHFLLQAKAEPGNINGLQLSPTVQATRSNYTKVHLGNATRYLEYFARSGQGGGRIIVDSLQSELGGWNWHKHNRNMVIEVTGDVEEHPDYHWVSQRELRQLLRVDHLINMDTRSVLGCLRLDEPLPAMASTPCWESVRDILSWLIDAKACCTWSPRLVPLAALGEWSRRPMEIACDDGGDFRIIAARIEAENREVRQWMQPLLEPRCRRLAAFLVKFVDGEPHVLVQARTEPGLRDLIELAPTVQRPGGAGWFESEALTEDPGRVRYDVELSEEGGRFQHAATQYRIVEVAADFPLDVPGSFRWMTVPQLQQLVQYGHCVNVEARTLLACLGSLS